jgi:hypothetical protein
MCWCCLLTSIFHYPIPSIFFKLLVKSSGLILLFIPHYASFDIVSWEWSLHLPAWLLFMPFHFSESLPFPWLTTLCFPTLSLSHLAYAFLILSQSSFTLKITLLFSGLSTFSYLTMTI